MTQMMTEDEVRDAAKIALGFNEKEPGIVQGTGQLTTFKQLGFPGHSDKPDGWYFPGNAGEPAIILETKKSGGNLQKYIPELLKNIDIVMEKYTKVVGILTNWNETRVFKNKEELTGLSGSLEHKRYYLALYKEEALDKQHIYEVTKRINNLLHYKFGMRELKGRMIFTACALVAQRYNPQNGLQNLMNMGYDTFHTWIKRALSTAIENDERQNSKLGILLEEYGAVKISIAEDQGAINEFIEDVCEIADLVNSDNWNGEDVMAIFFNEFNRYRKKSDAGQVFTPDHVTSFMYRLIDVNKDDRVLDATCGSGAFLVKAMCNMIKEAGGVNASKAKEIKDSQLYGIEMYRDVFALACANMMIHKDGKTNLLQADAKSSEASKWIKEKNITKVLMNPPYERKYRCADIVCNVLDSVPPGTKCAIILPDKKIEKEKKLRDALERHTLTTIIKMPENLFFGIGITTSIFLFETGRPQDNKNIIGYYIEDDGLETVKNQGRQDIKNCWPRLEDYWITAIRNGDDSEYGTKQIIDAHEHQSYQMPVKPFEVTEEDFKRTMLDRLMYEQGIEPKMFYDALLDRIIYDSEVTTGKNGQDVNIIIKDGDET